MSGGATFAKFATAQDAAGDQVFAQKVGHKGVQLRESVDPATALPWADLSEEDRAFIMLLRLARRFKDMTECGCVPAPRAVQLMRALHAAELLDTSEADKARALIPVEVRKALAEQKGQQVVRKKLVAQIYRPGVDAAPAPSETPVSATAAPPSGAPRSAPAPAAAAPTPSAAAPTPAAAAPTRPPVAPPPPRAKAEAAPSSDVAVILAEVNAAALQLKKADHFMVLGLDRTAQEDKVKAAYLQLVRKWHPDRLASATGAGVEDTRRKMELLFSAVNEAHRVLTDRTTRTAYLEDLKRREMSSGSGHATGKPSPPVRAEDAKMHAQMGKVFVRKQDWANAQREYKLSVGMDPGLVEYKVEYAWAFLMNNANGPEQTRRQTVADLLADAVKDTTYGDGHYRLGLVRRMLGDTAQAEACFKKAAKLDKNHAEAAKEVRLIEMREERAKKAAAEATANQKEPSLMDKLMGKKTGPQGP